MFEDPAGLKFREADGAIQLPQSEMIEIGDKDCATTFESQDRLPLKRQTPVDNT